MPAIVIPKNLGEKQLLILVFRKGIHGVNFVSLKGPATFKCGSAIVDVQRSIFIRAEIKKTYFSFLSVGN